MFERCSLRELGPGDSQGLAGTMQRWRGSLLYLVDIDTYRWSELRADQVDVRYRVWRVS